MDALFVLLLKGDSGGALVQYDEQQVAFQRGIVSWGRKPPDPRYIHTPEVYVRISVVVPWIRRNFTEIYEFQRELQGLPAEDAQE